MTLFMLDTNAVSDLVVKLGGPIAQRVELVGSFNVSISIIVSAEIEFGLENKKNAVLRDRTQEVLRRLSIIRFEQPADLHYGRLRAMLKSQGLPIGPNDLFIAAHALALDATLVTDNMREFSRVPGLAVENWLRQ